MGGPGRVLKMDIFNASIEDPVSIRMASGDFPTLAVIIIEDGCNKGSFSVK